MVKVDVQQVCARQLWRCRRHVNIKGEPVMTREFDLNIERVLENWTVAHALREVIANALDKQALTGTVIVRPGLMEPGRAAWRRVGPQANDGGLTRLLAA